MMLLGEDTSVGRSLTGPLAQDSVIEGTSYLVSPPWMPGPAVSPSRAGAGSDRAEFKPPPLSSWMTLGNFPNLSFSICKMEGGKYLLSALPPVKN